MQGKQNRRRPIFNLRRARARARRASVCFRFIYPTMMTTTRNSRDLHARLSLPLCPPKYRYSNSNGAHLHGAMCACKTGIPDRREQEWSTSILPACAGRSVGRQRVRDIFRYVNKYKVDRRAFLGYKGLCNCLCIIGTGKLLTATRCIQAITRRPKVSRPQARRGAATPTVVAASTSARGALQDPPRSATSPYIDPAIAVGKRTGAPAPMCAYEI